MRRVIEPLARMGARSSSEPGDGRAPLRSRAARSAGTTHALAGRERAGEVGVLLAGLQADGTTRVREPLASRDHTERMLRHFGVTLDGGDARRGDAVGAGAARAPTSTLPGDFSSAAFLVVAALLVPGSRAPPRPASA